MFARSKKTRLLELLVVPRRRPVCLFSAGGLPSPLPMPIPKFVDLWSRMDEFHGARGVQRAVAPRELKRAAPDAGLDKLLDAFLDAQPQHRPAGPQGRHHPRRALPVRPHRAAPLRLGLGGEDRARHAGRHRRCRRQDQARSTIAPRSTSPRSPATPTATTTIRDLLTMSSGVGSTASPTTGATRHSKLVANTLRAQDRRRRRHRARNSSGARRPRGTRFRYASADSQVLGLVLATAVEAAARRVPVREDLAADGRRGPRHLARSTRPATRPATAA